MAQRFISVKHTKIRVLPVEDGGTFDETGRRTVGTRYSLVSNAYAIICRRVYVYTNVERAAFYFPRKFSSAVHRCTLKPAVAYFVGCTEHLALEPCHNKTSAALPRRCSFTVAKQKCFTAVRRAIKGTESPADKLCNVSPD